jgi:pseudouridine-5'-phosphate glycosidase
VPVIISPAVRQALESVSAVVALESAVITHGLPKDAALDAVRRQGAACDAAGATPAVVAVFNRELRVGLTLDECVELAERTDAVKVSPWNLASTVARGGYGGTTVAATMIAAELAGIHVMSTGGIGGVHPGDGQDVSADLTELARRRVCVVCSGPKSILDAAATLERLETAGVPVLGWRSERLAGFLAHTVHLPVSGRVDTHAELVAVVRRHWELAGTALVVSNPLPESLAIPAADLTAADEDEERGASRTPAALQRLQSRLGDRVITANVALLERNAGLAAQIARALVSRS